MWARFWRAADTSVGDGRVPNAGLTLPPEAPAPTPNQSPPAEDLAGEVEAFLARFYAHQRC